MFPSLCMYSVLLLLCLSSLSFALAITNPTLKGCRNKCGNIELRHPFGVGDGCFMPGFEITCNNSIPFLSDSNIQLLEILEGEVRINSTQFIASYCPPSVDDDENYMSIKLPEGGPYTLSTQSNKFVIIGCNTVGLITDNITTSSQCLSQCFTADQIDYGFCNGKGCCKTPIASADKNLYFYAYEAFGERNVSSFSPCNFAFVAEAGIFKFSQSDLWNFSKTADISLKLEWAIGEMNCKEASDSGSLVCGERSKCVDSNRSSGYLCQCSNGSEGNPYLNYSLGCQDINECMVSTYCVPEATCKNHDPGYKCSCPSGSFGDGLIHGTGCRKHFPVVNLVTGFGVSILVLIGGSLWVFWTLKRRKLMNLKEKFFQQNGGLLLRNHLSYREGFKTEATKIFTSEELRKATNNYSDSQILGRGGYGTVYKGILDDLRVVAIKKSKVMDKNQIQQFINEVVILTQINHRNVVKLLGCCLETEVPLLVYEYVSNGTLYQHLHENDSTVRIPWEDRLRIATESAEALAYLHSSASMPIIHRDVKSSNILLDKAYTAKVSDFGASRLVSLDQYQITTLVQGTLGYLDPEYFQTSQLTAKSDVYSFGVVLVELLTGQKPISFERSEMAANLAMYFLSSMRTNTLVEILENHILKEGKLEELETVARLAMKCLRLKGDRRPTMQEVAQELILLRGFDQYNREASICLADEEQPSYGKWEDDVSHSGLFPMNSGR